MAFNIEDFKTGMGGETGGAMLDLLRQMSAAGQQGVSIGIERKERQEEQVLGMSQTLFKERYNREEPFILDKDTGQERSLTQRELLGSMMGVPPKGIGWRERAEEAGKGFIPGLRFDPQTGDYNLTSTRVPKGATAFLMKRPREAALNMRLALSRARIDDKRWKEAGDLTRKQWMNIIPSPDRFTPGTPEFTEELKQFDIYMANWHKNYNEIRKLKRKKGITTRKDTSTDPLNILK